MSRRIFIGCKLPRKIIPIVGMMQSTIVDINKSYRWVSGNNLHLTILFLGNQEDAVLDDIVKQLELIISKSHKFTIKIDGTGVFSKNHSNNILWLGVKQSRNQLDKINYELRGKLSSFMAKDKIKKFIPHITIPKKKKEYFNDKIDVKNFLNSVYFPMDLHIKYFTLFESVETTKGVRYVKISDFPLL